MSNHPTAEVSQRGELPETRRLLLNRDRVLALDAGLPILVIRGPSGYGKTVLAELWLRQRRGSAFCGWAALDAASRDPLVFLDQLLDAFGASQPSGREIGIHAESERAMRFSELCSHLANDPEARHCLVIDDVHLIANSDSLGYLEKLLNLVSERFSVCLVMQPFDLELGLGGLTVRGWVSWIDERNLVLSRDEVSQFAELRGRRLDPTQLEWLYRATEGWPAFVHLALAVPVAISPIAEPSAGLGSAPLRDYIHERFIASQSNDDRDVLWALACLGSTPVPLLETLFASEPKVSRALLHFRALGIVQNQEPDDPSIITLHALVRDGANRLLSASRGTERVPLLARAAEWLWQNGYGAWAVRMALDAGPPLAELARRWIVDIGFFSIFRSGQHQTLFDLAGRWERVSGSCDLDVDSLVAWVLVFQRQFELAESRLQRIEASSRTELIDAARLQRAVMLALRDDFATAGELAKQWIASNAGNASYQLGIASTVHAFCLKCMGRYDDANYALRDAMFNFATAQSAYGTGWAHVVGALNLMQAGRYRGALAQVEAGLLRCPSSQGFGGLRTLLRGIEAFLRYERNEFDQLRDILGEALPALSDQGIVDAVTFGYIAAARSRSVSGDFGTALDILSEGEAVALQRNFVRLSGNLRAERALLLLRNGAVSRARALVEGMATAPPYRISVQMLRARIATAEGDAMKALKLLRPVIDKARRLGRQSRLSELLFCVALAEDLRRDEAACHAALSEALEIASTEGLLRTALDEGRPLMTLLVRWLERGASSMQPAIRLAQQILELGNAGFPGVIPVPQPLPAMGGASSPAVQLGHLSAIEEAPQLADFNKRERQLLALLSEGLSNAQLASRCFISEGTVKWYLHNLYEKIGVGSRTALLRAARERGVRL
ncbi:LuxR C-terminal-related transcriptional regulator [Nevskia sp.]|uniref:LuxR C-terminal-related transcriptional regulator n=1 Tax=Nevskia sp. TaxID=1929292 RepID=UPI003F71BF83